MLENPLLTASWTPHILCLTPCSAKTIVEKLHPFCYPSFAVNEPVSVTDQPGRPLLCLLFGLIATFGHWPGLPASKFCIAGWWRLVAAQTHFRSLKKRTEVIWVFQNVSKSQAFFRSMVLLFLTKPEDVAVHEILYLSYIVAPSILMLRWICDVLGFSISESHWWSNPFCLRISMHSCVIWTYQACPKSYESKQGHWARNKIFSPLNLAV